MPCKLVCVLLTAIAVSILSLCARKPLHKVWKILWPVRRDELDRVVLLSATLFLTAFNYHALKAAKDALVVTSSGATIIPFIKVWVLLPTACLVSYAYAHSSVRLGTKRTFFITIACFLAFFGTFGLLLYPQREAFFLHSLADKLITLLPKGLHTSTLLVRKWPITAFYVISELWGVIVLNVCFWGFANEITSSEEAKRFYPILRTCLNIAGVFSGTVGIHLASAAFDPLFPIGKDAWDQAVVKTIFIVLCSGVGILSLFYYITNHLPHKRTRDFASEAHNPKKEKQNFLGREGLLWLWNSPKVICLAVSTFGFGFILNTTEVLWKIQLSKLYPQASDFSCYANRLSIITSITAAFSAFFLSRGFLTSTRYMALATPFIASVTTIIFFGLLFFPEWVANLSCSSGYSVLSILALFGAIQNCSMRAAKSALMDIDKDLTLIGLDYTSRIRGKAFVDGVASRSGKTFASLMLSLLFTFCGSVEQSFTAVALIDMFVLIMWGRSSVAVVGKRSSQTDSEKIKDD